MSTAYLNGEFIPLQDANVSVMDRGFLFGDGVYEVIPVYAGQPFRLTHHLQRLHDSLTGVRIDCSLSQQEWQDLFAKLIALNAPTGDLSIYLQITRGIQTPRDHSFTPPSTPTIFAMATPINDQPSRQYVQAGAAAITVADIRWQYCHLKTTNLLANVLLRQQAVDQGAQEAILINHGCATEGAASNLFIVNHDVLITPPKSSNLLPGITRDLLLELAGENDIPHREAEIPATDLATAQEIWLTSSTKEIIPVTQLNNQAVGDAKPGPVWHRMVTIYQTYKQRVRLGQCE